MKLVQITFHFEYGDLIESLLDRHGIEDYVRYPMMEGKDRDGKHFGTQVFPGSFTIVQAQVPGEQIESLMSDLRRFREQKPSHRHLQALVMPIEQRL